MTTMTAAQVRLHTGGMEQAPDPEVPERAQRPRSYSARYKAEILDEYERLDKAGKGALLRREGLYTSLISEWRKQRDRGALQALATPSGRPPADPVERENARLRRENQRLTAELDKAKQGDRGPGKALGAVGAARHRQRPAEDGRRRAVIDQAIDELAPLVGVKAACQAVGRARGSHYRRTARARRPSASGCRRRSRGRSARWSASRCSGSCTNPSTSTRRPPPSTPSCSTRASTWRRPPPCTASCAPRARSTERRRQATHPPAVKPELLATKPNEVYSWDITKLLGPAKWTYFYLYVIIDIYSRYVPGWMLARAERASLAERLLADTIANQHVNRGQLTIHADSEYVEAGAPGLPDPHSDGRARMLVPGRSQAS